MSHLSRRALRRPRAATPTPMADRCRPACGAPRTCRASYPLVFFDRHLRNRPQRLLAGRSAAFPEVHFIP